MRRKKLDSVEIDIPDWINHAGRSRRAFEAAEKEIHEEKRVPELVYALERLATKEEVERVRRGGPRRPVGVKVLRAVEPSRRREPSNRLQALGPAVVAAAVLIALSVVAFVLFWGVAERAEVALARARRRA